MALPVSDAEDFLPHSDEEDEDMCAVAPYDLSPILMDPVKDAPSHHRSVQEPGKHWFPLHCLCHSQCSSAISGNIARFQIAWRCVTCAQTNQEQTDTASFLCESCALFDHFCDNDCCIERVGLRVFSCSGPISNPAKSAFPTHQNEPGNRELEVDRRTQFLHARFDIHKKVSP